MIRIENLRFQYPKSDFALEIPSLHVERAEHLALTGASGCGKSTLLRLIAGIQVPSQGIVDVDGTLVSSLGDDARRRFRILRLGLVFQSFELIDYLNVLDNVLLPCYINSSLKSPREMRERGLTLLERVGLAEKSRRRLNQLSHGELQRVAICRSLLAEPAVLLADEPTGNLDPKTATRVLDLLMEQATGHSATLIMVTHDHGLIDRFHRRIDLESLVQDGAPL